MNHWVYDIESYPNFFSLTAVCDETNKGVVFEISERKNSTDSLLTWLRELYIKKDKMVGFNNIGYDYHLVQWILDKAKIAKELKKPVEVTAFELYTKTEQIIKNMFNDRKPVIFNPMIAQIDLYKIHHFDNKAKATGLKMLQFNMKSDSIEDLPYEPGTFLTSDEMDVTLKYNAHDVIETLKFYRLSKDAIDFRTSLGKKYGIDFTNHNDTKIGKDYFINRLESAMPGVCYKNVDGKRVMNQTIRDRIVIGDILFPYINFDREEFVSVKNWFEKKVISETKGVLSNIKECDLGGLSKFASMKTHRRKLPKEPSEQDIISFKKENTMCWIEREELKSREYVYDENGERKREIVFNEKGTPRERYVTIQKVSYHLCWNQADTLNVVVDGFRFDFGTGGIHGSIESSIVESDDDYLIVDWDVASMYPNIAISNRVYPEHLSDKFCDIYEDVYNERKSYKKGSPENAVMKLALNGVYGDSNNQYSPFYDPKYTMAITINGQLSLCMFAEKLLRIDGLSLIQCNTDGVTARVPRKYLDEADSVAAQWEKDVGLELEKNTYSKMVIRDVNNYIAIYENNGKVKRKGAYEYAGLGWHQNQGGLVIPKAAEHELLKKGSVEDFILSHKDKYDFLLRTKVPRNSQLVLVTEDGIDIPQQNICRYYACASGGRLVKIMPALEGKDVPRRIGIDTQWKVRTCNNIERFEWNIDYDYYITEAKKLVNAVVSVDNNDPE